jgi:hypothetical protein
LDRFLPQAEIIQITGRGYRLRRASSAAKEGKKKKTIPTNHPAA